MANTSLRKAEADKLLILDCCYACGIMKGGEEHTKSFELLAACGKNTTTPKPGKRSFSRALINSLRDKLIANANHPFDTKELHRAISKRKEWNDPPFLYNFDDGFPTRPIVLAPLDKSQVERKPAPVHNAAELSLRIAFEKKTALTNQEASTLAQCLAEAAKRSALGISAIDWLKFVPSLPSKERAQTRKLEQIVRATQTLSGAMNSFLDRKRRLENDARERDTSGAADGTHDSSVTDRPFKRAALQGPNAPLTPRTSSGSGTPGVASSAETDPAD